MSNKSYLSVYAKSFNWAGFFLPKETFKKCSALYDFCRVADNIADDDDKIENKEKKFNQFENDFFKKNFDNPIIKNMWDLVEEFNISFPESSGGLTSCAAAASPSLKSWSTD